MSSSSRNKRTRTNYYRSSHSYRDSVLIDDGYDIVHASEASVRNPAMGLQKIFRVNRFSNLGTGSWDHITTWSPPDDEAFALEEDGGVYEAMLEADIVPPTGTSGTSSTATDGAAKKVPRSTVSKRPHVVWMGLNRQAYLDEIMRWYGRGDFMHSTKCLDCVARGLSGEEVGTPTYRCRDCFSPDLSCQACCVKRHRFQPFHRIQKWSNGHFTDISLSSIGLSIQLNHSGTYCENPIPCHAAMLVLHTNGIHKISIKYCGCSQQIPQHIQLLRRRLYPASQMVPKTCASFELLRHLHMLSLTTKASMYDLYRCLEKSTDNTGINPFKSRYRALMRMSLQWRHLQMLKWGGWGQENDGMDSTGLGQLAVRCPSCPYPGINLPANWESAPDDMKFLYAMIICMDANFRLKNQLVSNYSQDPGLGIGWSYMVPRVPYNKYVLDKATDTDISTCVGFQALAKANTRFSKGLRYTGVNLTVCGRSEMILPVGVGNLHKGERYSNMDYIFGSTLRFVAAITVLISYDIACQWFVNLFKRIEEDWPSEIKPRSSMTLSPAIPKLHKPAHQTSNHQMFSLNYIPGVGLSDCECPKRVWAPHNSLGSATKTQGPGSWQDVLDDHFGFWNWLKYMSLGTSLLRRYRNAVAQRNLQMEGHRGFTESMDSSLVDKWEGMCRDWENAPFPKKKVPNPYHTQDATMSEAQVKKELAEEETKYIAGGGNFPHATTTSKFISMGHELEEAKRRLKQLIKESAKNSARADAALSEQRNGLLVRIRAWEQLLPIYMPGLLQYHSDYPPPVAHAENAEDYPIYLPSSIPEPHRTRICAPGLANVECRFRLGQMTDALISIRRILKIKSRMIYFRNKNIRGQRGGTRSTTVINRVHERALLGAAKYRAARSAYLSLLGPGQWEDSFKVLKDGDIRGFQDPNRLRPRVGRKGTMEDDQLLGTGVIEPNASEEEGAGITLLNELRDRRDGSGATRRTLSWIWTTKINVGSTTSDDDDDILRSEWAKSRARSLRAKEEVMLLKEEMQRTLQFLKWKSVWWRNRLRLRKDATPEVQEGSASFALSQADIQDSLGMHFRKLWQIPLQDIDQPTGIDDDNDDDGEASDDAEEDSIEEDSPGELDGSFNSELREPAMH